MEYRWSICFIMVPVDVFPTVTGLDSDCMLIWINMVREKESYN